MGLGELGIGCRSWANLFQLKFNSEFDMNRVLKGGPWTFDNQVLLLVRWKSGMTAGNVKFESVSY